VRKKKKEEMPARARNRITHNFSRRRPRGATITAASYEAGNGFGENPSLIPTIGKEGSTISPEPPASTPSATSKSIPILSGLQYGVAAGDLRVRKFSYHGLRARGGITGTRDPPSSPNQKKKKKKQKKKKNRWPETYIMRGWLREPAFSSREHRDGLEELRDHDPGGPQQAGSRRTLPARPRDRHRQTRNTLTALPTFSQLLSTRQAKLLCAAQGEGERGRRGRVARAAAPSTDTPPLSFRRRCRCMDLGSACEQLRRP